MLPDKVKYKGAVYVKADPEDTPRQLFYAMDRLQGPREFLTNDLETVRRSASGIIEFCKQIAKHPKASPALKKAATDKIKATEKLVEAFAEWQALGKRMDKLAK